MYWISIHWDMKFGGSLLNEQYTSQGLAATRARELLCEDETITHCIVYFEHESGMLERVETVEY